jgi:hypothetical protein
MLRFLRRASALIGRSRLLLLGALIAALVGVPSPAAAMCTCWVSATGAADQGTPVVLGTVVEVAVQEIPRYVGERPIQVKLDVLRSWGSEAHGGLILHTTTNSMSCDGYNFREGETYLLVAVKNRPRADAIWPPEGTYGVYVCGVWPLERAGEIITQLDEQREDAMKTSHP